MQSALSPALRRISKLLRLRGQAGLDLSAPDCLRVAFLLLQAAGRLHAIEERAAEAEELEYELLLVAGDIERGADPAPASFQAALKAQQAEIQRRLDGGGPEHVSRPGLSALSTPIAGNVVSFPLAPWRPRLDCQGDDGGDAA
jgi:hypothetical protein